MEYNINNIRNFPITTGVYKISFKNSNTNRVYIGSASSNGNKGRNTNGFYKRWRIHINSLLNNKSGNTILQNAYNKYGKDNMIFEILEECSPEICLDREQFYIDKYDSYNSGYNGRPLASNNRGFKQSEYHKKVLFDKYKLIRDTYSDEVKKLYNEGKTTRNICCVLNISRNFLKRIFDENNIIPRKEKGCKKKPVFQYNMKGEFTMEFDSIRDCVNKLNVNSRGITIVLNGQCKHYKNMYYSHVRLEKEEVLNNINNLNIKSKNRKYLNIMQIDNKGNIIKIWRDVKEIIDDGICKKNGLNKALRLQTYYNKYYWKTQ